MKSIQNVLIFCSLLFSTAILGCQNIADDVAQQVIAKMDSTESKIIEKEVIVEVPVEKIVEVEKEVIVEVLVEKIVEVEKEVIVEVPVSLVTPTPIPTPIPTPTPQKPASFELECDITSNPCKLALGTLEDATYVVNPRSTYDPGLSIITEYKSDEINLTWNICNPKSTPCWKDGSAEGYAAVIAQPHLNDYSEATEKWIPSLASVGWVGRITYTHKIVFRTPDTLFYWDYNPILTVSEPEGRTVQFSFKSWRAEDPND
ncbi:MAG: hypothetical protein VX359_05965 [Chloroflexota bacterium]